MRVTSTHRFFSPFVRVRVCTLLAAAALFAACGDDGGGPLPALDGGSLDGGEFDAAVDASADANAADLGAPDLASCEDADGDGHANALCGGDDCDDANPARYPGAAEVCDGDDEDCDDATLGADADGDGYTASACCDGARCGDDCDDALNTVNPLAAETCNGGVDDDCDGAADSADGVCVACAAGFTGFDGDCADIDECAVSGFCGTGAVSCMNESGTFACACATGYAAASATGALCENVNECAAAVNPCGAGTCTDNAGSYACACAAGFRFDGATCVDIDECAVSGFCGTGAASCANEPGSFACACAAGYAAASATGSLCANVDECASATTCGRALSGGSVNGCADAIGGYTCTCGAGFTPSGSGLTASCVDVDECAEGLDDCDEDPGALCSNTSGAFTCACPPDFSGSARGASGCVLTNPALSGIGVGAGALLSPTRKPATSPASSALIAERSGPPDLALSFIRISATASATRMTSSDSPVVALPSAYRSGRIAENCVCARICTGSVTASEPFSSSAVRS